MPLIARSHTVHRRDERAQRLPKGALGSLDRRDGRLHALRRAHVPLGREPVHDRARVRLAAGPVQEDRVLVRDPDNCLPGLALLVRHCAVRVLPPVPRLAPPALEHRRRLGELGRHPRRDMDTGVHHLRGASLALSFSGFLVNH